MDFQAALEQLSALGKRSEPFSDRYMSETERGDFDSFVDRMSPIYQSVILLSTVGLTIGELDASELVEVLSGGIEGIEDELRRQSLKGFFDKTSAFISPCTDSEREVILNAWEPKLGSIASEFIALEGNIKQSFFGTFGIADPIDYVFSEYKKSFCIWDCPISRLEDDQLEGAWNEYQSAQAYANSYDAKQRWRGWEESFFNNRLKRAKWAFEWLSRAFLDEPEDEPGITPNRKSLGEGEREFLFEKKHWNILLAKITPSLRLMIKEHIEFSDTVLVFGPDDEDSDVSRTLSLNLSMSEQTNNMLSASDLSDIQESIGKCLIETLVELRAFPQGATHRGMPLYQDSSDFSDDQPTSSEEIGYVYFIRNQDLYKIGITKDLKRRMDELKPDEIINTVRCKNSREVEKDLHDTFKDYRLPQTEYFRLDSAQIGLVNKLMMRLADF